MPLCEFCNSDLKTARTLTIHKQANKKCLSIQAAKNSHIKSLLVDCKKCGENYSPSYISLHQVYCKGIKDQLELAAQKIAQLELQLNEVKGEDAAESSFSTCNRCFTNKPIAEFHMKKDKLRSLRLE